MFICLCNGKYDLFSSRTKFRSVFSYIMEFHALLNVIFIVNKKPGVGQLTANKVWLVRQTLNLCLYRLYYGLYVPHHTCIECVFSLFQLVSQHWLLFAYVVCAYVFVCLHLWVMILKRVGVLLWDIFLLQKNTVQS